MADVATIRARRTALVTGGSRGIGAAIAGELSERGTHVLTPARHALDLSDANSIERYVQSLEDNGQTIDILVNNAGINFVNPFEKIASGTWQSMLQTNLTAPFRLAQAVAPQMRGRGWGRIVNISSIFGIVTRAQRAAYSTTKAGLAGLTRTLAVEMGRDNVLVNCIAPGYVGTELTRQNNSEDDLERIAESIPVGRLAEPSEIAKFVAFLCSEENTYITGQVLVADGGFTCL